MPQPSGKPAKSILHSHVSKEVKRVAIEMPVAKPPEPPPVEESLAELARHLEDEFFSERDVELIEAIHQSLAASELEHKLAELLGISDPDALAGLSHLGVGIEVMAAAALLPMIETAWCDGDVAPPEKQAIMQAADEMEIARDTPMHQLLDNWLEHRPSRAAVEAWKKYVAALCLTLTPTVVFNLRRAIIGRAEKVASAAGGILGFGSKISTAERHCLDDLTKAFRQPGPAVATEPAPPAQAPAGSTAPSAVALPTAPPATTPAKATTPGPARANEVKTTIIATPTVAKVIVSPPSGTGKG